MTTNDQQHPDPVHPCTRLTYKDALAYLERWITVTILTPAQRARNVRVSLRDYFDGDPAGLKERPYCGVRIVEVAFHTAKASASYMQVESPWGIAICGQVERCALALIEGWNGKQERTGSYETDEEFDRLQSLFEAADNDQPTAEQAAPADRLTYQLSIARHALAGTGNQPTADDLRVWIGSSAAEAGIELDVRDIAVRDLTPHAA